MFADALALRGLEGGLLYTALSVFFGATLVGFRVVGGKRRGRALRSMLLIGLGVLTLDLLAIGIVEGRLPLETRAELLVLLAWSVALITWASDRRAHSHELTAAVVPAIALLVAFALFVPPPSAATPGLRSAGTVLHVLFAIAGCAAVTFAAGTGALYLWQIRKLKQDPTAAVASRLPPLETVDRLNFRSAAWGVALLALSLVIGWAFIPASADLRAWFLDPTVLAVSVGLLVYALLFAARAWLGWRGRRAALLSVIGFFVVVVGGAAVTAFCQQSAHPS